MNRFFTTIALLLLLTSCTPTPPEVITGGPYMSLSSSAFLHGGQIPDFFTCYGDATRLPFTLRDIPEKTKSLAVVLLDPDATGGTAHHWMMWNIPPTKRTFSSTETLPYPEGKTSFGTNSYIPPCPPPGDAAHRYVLSVYALDETLSLPHGSSYADLNGAMRNHILDKVSIVGTAIRSF